MMSQRGYPALRVLQYLVARSAYKIINNTTNCKAVSLYQKPIMISDLLRQLVRQWPCALPCHTGATWLFYI